MPTDPAPLAPAGRPDPLGQVTTTVYDGSGLIVSVTDPPGPITYTVYDARGRPPVAPPPADPNDEPPDEPHVVG